MADQKKKNRSGVVGITGFYYAVLKNDSEEGATYEDPVRVNYIQNVSIETEQEIAKGYGDNMVAEMAVSTGVTTLELQFHAIPLEDRVVLLVLKNEDDMFVQRSKPTPPYVAVALEKTKADGSSELVGLTKGMFTLPSSESQTKEDSLEFGSDTVSGEFSGREYDDATQIFMHVKKDDREKRKKFMDKIFNPSDTEDTGEVEG
ncbi:major tail protein [Oceanobacillus jeddahense]|uniref:major tail protein n=1 Tax=Oceanobacillus jeddahense TaxID=1462527 RepID=UPI0006943BCD|nr:major tail protein [Oceanobacillus jeddahense]